MSKEYKNICNVVGLPNRETYGYKYIEACAAIWGIDPKLIRRITVEADNSGYHQDVLQVTVVLTGTKDLLPEADA